MSVTSLFSLALSLSFLAGLNLYLTTFLAGLAVHSGWADAALHPALAAVGHPAVIIISGILFLAEFVVDKIPWVDSTWDAVHTVIRPVGAALLAWGIMAGQGDGWIMATAVLAVGIALSSHLTKSGVRLLLNASPEPFSNILASFLEDGLVLGLLLLSLQFPITGFVACLALLASIGIALPRLFRLVKANLILMWKKLRSRRAAAKATAHSSLPATLTVRQLHSLADSCRELPSPTAASTAPGPWDPASSGRQTNGATVMEDIRIAWAVPVVTGKIRGFTGLRGNHFGTLVSLHNQPGTLHFLPRSLFGKPAVKISLPGCEIRHESVFLSENLIAHSPADKLQATFRLPRGQHLLAARLTADLRERLGLTPPPAAILSEPTNGMVLKDTAHAGPPGRSLAPVPRTSFGGALEESANSTLSLRL